MNGFAGWKELNVQGVRVQAKVDADGCLRLRRDDVSTATNKVARYNDRVASLQHELSHRLADVAGMDVEMQQLCVELGTSNDDEIFWRIFVSVQKPEACTWTASRSYGN